MSDLNGYEQTHEAVRRVLDAERVPVRQVAGAVGIAADDGAEAWASLAEDIERVVPLADRGQRWALLKAKSKCEQMVRTCRKLRGDVDRVMEAGR